MDVNQTECTRIEQRFVTNYLLAKKYNNLKFTEECVMCTEKYIFCKKKSISLTV